MDRHRVTITRAGRTEVVTGTIARLDYPHTTILMMYCRQGTPPNDYQGQVRMLYWRVLERSRGRAVVEGIDDARRPQRWLVESITTSA